MHRTTAGPGSNLHTLIDAGIETLADPRTAKALAAYSGNYREVLTALGFSPDEAPALATASGIPPFPLTMEQNRERPRRRNDQR